MTTTMPIEPRREEMTNPSAQSRPGRFRLSVIIPCLNERRVIGRCLDSLVAQDFPRDAFEVIVVDNGSSDGTPDIARSYEAALNLTVLSNPLATIAGLRNMGAASAKGELLAFLDSDCLPPPAWLSRAAALLSAEGCGVIGGYYLIPADSSWVARAWFDDRASKKKEGKVSYIPSSDLLVSRSNFSKIGGFDETLATNEDCEFSQRASKQGLTIMAFSALAVTHLGSPQTLLAFYRRERWHGTSVFKVFLRNVSAFPNAKAILFAIYFLLCLIGLGLGLFRAITSGHFDLMAASFAALIVAPLSIGFWKALSYGKWNDLLPMAFLYFVYGIARAMCMVTFGKGRGR